MGLGCLTAPTMCSERMAVSCFEIVVGEAFRSEQMKTCAPTLLPAYRGPHSWSAGDLAGFWCQRLCSGYYHPRPFDLNLVTIQLQAPRVHN